MTAQTLTHTSNPVRRSVQADGLFCAICGVVFTLDAESLRLFVGLDSSAPVFILGAILLVYGITLFYLATYKSMEHELAVTATILNVIWVIASTVLLAADPFHFTTAGKWALLILSDVVALLAVWEFLAVRRMRRV